jgi:hypothetical protein
VWQPPAPARLATPADVGRALGIARDYGRRLIEAGLLGTPSLAGTAVLGQHDRLHALAVRPILDPDSGDLPSALIVKAGPPEPDNTNDPREWQGFHATMPPDVLDDAVSRWWPVARAEATIGALFVVTVASIVVHVASIRAVQAGHGGRFAFHLAPADDEMAMPYRGARIRPKAGPLYEPVGI